MQRWDRIKKLTSLLAIAVVSLGLAACMPINDHEVNADLFKDKEELKVRVADLRPGMHKKAVFEKLGIPREKFEFLSAEGVQICLYGNSQVQGSPEQLEKFRNQLMSYEGYSLPYRNLESNGTLGFGKMKVQKSGHDLRLILVFERDRLIKSAVEGQETVNQKEDQYFWDGLVRKGLFAAF